MRSRIGRSRAPCRCASHHRGAITPGPVHSAARRIGSNPDPNRGHLFANRIARSLSAIAVDTDAADTQSMNTSMAEIGTLSGNTARGIADGSKPGRPLAPPDRQRTRQQARNESRDMRRHISAQPASTV